MKYTRNQVVEVKVDEIPDFEEAEASRSNIKTSYCIRNRRESCSYID